MVGKEERFTLVKADEKELIMQRKHCKNNMLIEMFLRSGASVMRVMAKDEEANMNTLYVRLRRAIKLYWPDKARAIMRNKQVYLKRIDK